MTFQYFSYLSNMFICHQLGGPGVQKLWNRTSLCWTWRRSREIEAATPTRRKMVRIKIIVLQLYFGVETCQLIKQTISMWKQVCSHVACIFFWAKCSLGRWSVLKKFLNNILVAKVCSLDSMFTVLRTIFLSQTLPYIPATQKGIYLICDSFFNIHLPTEAMSEVHYTMP